MVTAKPGFKIVTLKNGTQFLAKAIIKADDMVSYKDEEGKPHTVKTEEVEKID